MPPIPRTRHKKPFTQSMSTSEDVRSSRRAALPPFSARRRIMLCVGSPIRLRSRLEPPRRTRRCPTCGGLDDENDRARWFPQDRDHHSAAGLGRQPSLARTTGLDLSGRALRRYAGSHELACKLCSARVSPGPNDLFLPEREAFSSGWGARGGAPIEGAPFPPSAHAARVISSEIFSTFDQNETLRLAAAIGPVERFVLYVRNGIGYLHSCWAAKVRWGHKDGFDSFLRASVDFEPATPILGPISYVDMIVGLFRADRISVRNFDVALQHPRKLFGDFLEVELGLPEGLDFPTGLVANASPSKVITEVQRALNVLGGRSKPGEAPSSHAALRQSLASPNGSRLVDLFLNRCSPSRNRSVSPT